MNHFIKKIMVGLIFMFGLLTSAYAHENIPADTSSPELQRIKSLEGRWMTTTSMFGKKNEKLYTEYEVTSAGSAVLERIFVGPWNMCG